MTVYSYPIAVKSSQSPRKDLVYSISSRRSLNQIFFTGSTQNLWFIFHWKAQPTGARKHLVTQPGKIGVIQHRKESANIRRILNMNLYRWQAASCASFVSSRAMSFIKTIKTWLESYYIPTILTFPWKPSWSHMYRDTAFTMANKIETEHSDFQVSTL